MSYDLDLFFFFSSRRRHTRSKRDWSSDVCSSDLEGFHVLGFPCNQFGGQEPGSADEIAAFCESHYDVTFPVFAKIDVNGADADQIGRASCRERVWSPEGAGCWKEQSR